MMMSNLMKPRHWSPVLRLPLRLQVSRVLALVIAHTSARHAR